MERISKVCGHLSDSCHINLSKSKNQSSLHIESPILQSNKLSELVSPTTNVWLKMDNMQPSGSFKIRGIGARCTECADNGAHTFVCSGGANASLAVAHSARELGCKCVLILEDRENPLLEEFRRYGVEVRFQGETWDEADSIARKLGSQDGWEYIEMFNHPTIISGHASLVPEILSQMPPNVEPDCIVLAVGGGGLLCGVCEGLSNANRNIPIYGVQTKSCALLEPALKAGKSIGVKIRSADGHELGTRAITSHAVSWSSKADVRSLVLQDQDSLDAVRRFLDDHRVMVESLCGNAIAAIYSRPEIFQSFKNIVVIVCGGSLVNVDQVVRWTPHMNVNEGEFMFEGTKFTYSSVKNSAGITHYTIKELGKLPTFCHASVDPNGVVTLAGCIGFELGTMNVGSGVGDETTKALRHIDCILTCLGGSISNLTKLSVFLKDNSKERFMEMNDAYGAYFKRKGVPVVSRITVGVGPLALGANMEIDGLAYMPPS